MRIHITKAPVTIKGPLKVKKASSIMMPDVDGPILAAQTVIDITMPATAKDVLDYVDQNIFSGVRGAIDAVAEEDSERSGFHASPMKKVKDEPVTFTVYGSDLQAVATVINAHVSGKPKFVKPEGEKDQLLHMTLVGNCTIDVIEELIVHMNGADAYISIDSAQIEMFGNQADEVDEKMAEADAASKKAAPKPLAFMKDATAEFNKALKNGELDDPDAAKRKAREYAKARIDEGHANKRVTVEDVHSAIDFMRVPNPEGMSLVQ